MAKSKPQKSNEEEYFFGQIQIPKKETKKKIIFFKIPKKAEKKSIFLPNLNPKKKIQRRRVYFGQIQIPKKANKRSNFFAKSKTQKKAKKKSIFGHIQLPKKIKKRSIFWPNPNEIRSKEEEYGGIQAIPSLAVSFFALGKIKLQLHKSNQR